MTDLVEYGTAELVSIPADPTGGRLVAWAEAARSAASLGISLAKTSFVPKDFRGKPEECAAAILFGDEVGLSPMQSLQSIYVISGKPAMYARAMVAVVLAAGHEVVTVSKTDSKVTVQGRRRGSDRWVEETWTADRARNAGYTSNAKYRTDPQAMLYARAAADICRQIAPDALAGIGYSAEEMELAEPAPTVTVAREAVSEGPTKVARKPRAKAPEPVEPPLDDEPVADEDGVIVEAEIVEDIQPDPTQGITAPQVKMIAALMGALGITDRDDALSYCVDVIRREIGSRNDLTKEEATAVIDALSADKSARDAAATLMEPTFDEAGS